jgi:hypothetical protein
VTTHANGSKYTGNFEDGMASGKGELRTSNGDKYIGDFKNNKKHG